MICRYCGQRIVWNEVEGWVMANDDHPFGLPATADCPIRNPRADGHALPEDFWSNDV
jgi:hypothetical protein